MTIQPIGSASVALYITPADLKEHGLTPAGLTLEQALELTRSAFRQAGMDLASLAEHGRMIFASDALTGLLTYFPV